MTDISTERAAAFDAINSERDYQDAGLGNARRHAGAAELTIGEHLLIIKKLLADAEAAWYSPDGLPDSLNHVRKIGGVAVRCMEMHGAPLRKPA